MVQLFLFKMLTLSQLNIFKSKTNSRKRFKKKMYIIKIYSWARINTKAAEANAKAAKVIRLMGANKHESY